MDLSVAIDQLNTMARGFVALIPSIMLGLVVFGTFYLISKAVQGGITRVLQQRKQQASLGLVLGRLAQFGVVLLGLLVALSLILPSFRPGDIISLLGIGSVAIGFAFRDILQNFLAGILILLTEPFRIGDQIVMESFEGTVETIETRATMIKTYDGRRVVIPNGELFTHAVTVNTAFKTRRSQYDVGIGYGDDIGRAKQIMLEAIKSVEGVVADPAPDVIVVDLAPSSVNLRARWWSDSSRGDVLNMQDRVITTIKQKVLENGIDLPFPTRQILFHDQTEATDGDRKREGWPAGKGEVPKPRSIGGPLHEIAEAQATNNGRG